MHSSESPALHFLFTAYSVLGFMRALGNFTMPRRVVGVAATTAYACARPGAGHDHKQDMSCTRCHSSSSTEQDEYLGFWGCLLTSRTWHFNATKFVNNSFPRFGLHKLLLLAGTATTITTSRPRTREYKATFLCFPPLPALLTSSFFGNNTLELLHSK